MGNRYVPGIWAKRFKLLVGTERKSVITQTNELFAQQTGVHRKLDPRRDRALCDKWLNIRDEVMMSRDNPFSSALTTGANYVNSALQQINPTNLIQSIVEDDDSVEAPWMAIARAEEKRGVEEDEREDVHNERIMEYIRCCDNLYETENKRKYTERNGEEGVKWCSAFVNWCMGEAGITGTRNARALSWLDWGKPLAEPEVGAICVMKKTTDKGTWRHVAFVDKVGGEFKMLGGNQSPADGSDSPDCVSFRPFYRKIMLGYRWPA